MGTVCSIPAGVIDDLMAFPTVPFDDRIGLKFRFPMRRLRLYHIGDALGRCIFRQSIAIHLYPSNTIYIFHIEYRQICI